MEKKKYRIADKRSADMRALLRALVAVYLLYTAYELCFRVADESIPDWVRVAVGAAMALAAVGFGVFTWKRYRADCEDAVLTDEELEQLSREREE